ncbi:hypothetical protein BBJ29_007965 [Phytophthora kernoviae]|uniref:RxLR effector protein n=1 Tax=Phytophthora kernoviae TaxID=325452 RepID=A0A3F2RE36_9STRA|nr:hypothetical protein BBP00_00008930 [Phytophthora kernoviae]RLN67367.1 hypothetical protein BBJ29_007965 [Phytophthora kernoviae]
MMRSCFFLLVAATTLLASSDAVPTKLSKIASGDQLQSFDTAPVDGVSNRFLRSTKTYDEIDSDDDIGSDDEDKKAVDDYEQVDEALAKNDYTADDVAAKLNLNLNGPLDQARINLYLQYAAHLSNN